MANYATSQTVDARTLGGIFAKCILNSDGAGLVAAGTQATAFLDDFGQSIASGFPAASPINRADASFVRGEVAAQTSVICWGCQIQLTELTVPAAAGQITAAPVVAASAEVLAEAQHNISVTLELKGQQYVLGSPIGMPCGHGSNGMHQNGGPGVGYFRFPDSLPLDLGPTDRFSMIFRAERGFNVTTPLGGILVYVYLPALTAINLSQLSGA